MYCTPIPTGNWVRQWNQVLICSFNSSKVTHNFIHMVNLQQWEPKKHRGVYVRIHFKCNKPCVISVVKLYITLKRTLSQIYFHEKKLSSFGAKRDGAMHFVRTFIMKNIIYVYVVYTHSAFYGSLVSHFSALEDWHRLVTFDE